MWHEKGTQCDACAWNGAVSPAPLIAQAVLFPWDLLTSFVRDELTAQAWLSFWALRSLPCIYVDVFCANTMLS